VIGTGGAEGADAQPASRIVISTMRTATLVDRDRSMRLNPHGQEELKPMPPAFRLHVEPQAQRT